MTLKDQITRTANGLRAWHQERTIFETTNLICNVMKAEGVSRSELADRLGTSKGHVTQLLDGTANMTLRTVSDMFVALGREFHPRESPIAMSPTYKKTTIAIDMPDFATSGTVVVDVANVRSMPAVAG